MPFIKSISGFRGTIGGEKGDNLTPHDIIESAGAYGAWILKNKVNKKAKIVIGRDARPSGNMVIQLVINTLIALGIDVVDIGLSTTPTVEMAVTAENADGGIIITASHNSKDWNALKLLNNKGEFISAQDGEVVLAIATEGKIKYADVDHLGTYTEKSSYIDYHIAKVLALPLVDVELVRSKKFKVVLDPVNSTGVISVLPLLVSLGCQVTVINNEMNGQFAHNPEPLPENLIQLAHKVKEINAHIGIAVDPDVDRLAFVCEDGEMFGEEYTLVAVADYILQNTPGNTVSNLSSTRALRDITEKYKGMYNASAVGEVNVVEKMKETNAVIGGEGNGGVIYPALHYGRDALVGVALMLTYLAKFGKSLSFLRSNYPQYMISKNKLNLPDNANAEDVLKSLYDKYSQTRHCSCNTLDGLKLEFTDGNWIHIRKSNTEPIIRVYAESNSLVTANNLINKIFQDVHEILNAPKEK